MHCYGRSCILWKWWLREQRKKSLEEIKLSSVWKEKVVRWKRRSHFMDGMVNIICCRVKKLITVHKSGYLYIHLFIWFLRRHYYTTKEKLFILHNSIQYFQYEMDDFRAQSYFLVISQPDRFWARSLKACSECLVFEYRTLLLLSFFPPPPTFCWSLSVSFPHICGYFGPNRYIDICR